MAPDRRNPRSEDRRKVERRVPKRGVTIRHDDASYVPKRVRNAKKAPR